jgi:capsular polysaccharide biosynthesis protein
MRYRAFLPKGDRRRVVLLAHPELGEELRSLIEEFRRDDLYVMGPTYSADWGVDETDATFVAVETLRGLTWHLKRLGPIDVIVDMLGSGLADDGDTWASIFFHLRPRGVYILAQRHTGPPDRARKGGAQARIDAFAKAYWLGKGEGAFRSPHEKELVQSCGRFIIDRSFLLVEKRQRHYVKLRESEVARMLPQRNTGDTVATIGRLPAGELVCRGEVISHGATVPIINMPEVMAYPEAHLNHFTGKIAVVGNSLLYADSTILPASYRYPLMRSMENPRIIQADRNFARVPASVKPTKRLSGMYYHLDCWHSGHFGHVMTEVVSRMWGWPQAKQQYPDLKAIFRLRFPNERDPVLERSLFTGYGIEPSDIVCIDEPAWVESIVTATPLWQNEQPFYVHPEISKVWGRLAQGLVGDHSHSPEKIFVSRRPGLQNRLCRNARNVEEVFERYGFTIVYPEELTIPQQATLFAGAAVIAGFAGSGLFSLLYAGKVTDVIVLSQEAYTARYEHLYTMVLGCRTHYFWSTPETPHPPGGWSGEAYQSAWEFDFSRHRETLEETLSSL